MDVLGNVDDSVLLSEILAITLVQAGTVAQPIPPLRVTVVIARFFVPGRSAQEHFSVCHVTIVSPLAPARSELL